MKNKSIYLSLIFFLIITVLSSSGAFAHPGRIDSPKNQASGTLQVYYLDVGQGDSTLIRTPENQYILIDAGNNN